MRHDFIWPIVTALKSAGAKRGALALAAVAVVSAGAAVGQTALTASTATPPKLSGIYAMTFTSVCQAYLTINGSSVSYSSQWTSMHVGTGTFTPSKADPTQGTLALNLAKASGPPLTVNNGGGGLFTRTAPATKSVAYSTTSTSVTIDGIPYDAAHGTIVSGVIQQFTFAGVEPGDGVDPGNCMSSGVGIHQ